MLQAADVTFAYGPGKAGLHGVSVAVPRGSLVGIIGPNGSGKTTLLKLLGGMLTPASGRITLDGRDLSSLARRELAKEIAVVPQETRLSFEYSVLEVVLMGRYPHLGAFELEGRDDLRIAREAMAATGTLALEERSFPTLSGGEKQRVIIAGALAQSAQLMLLDEPTAALDPGYQIEIAALLGRLNADRGVTMAVATHDLNFAAGLCRQPGAASGRPRPRGGSDRAGAHARIGAGALRRRGRRPLPRGRRPPDGGAPAPRPAGGLTVSLRRRVLLTVVVFGAVAAAACVLAPMVGSAPISLRRVFDRSIPFADNADAQIFFISRLPRTLAAALVGAALAASGVVFQALLRNPLATPFTLGVSSGAALGAMLAITFPLPLAIGALSAVPVASFAGALGAVAVVYFLSTVRRHGLSTSVLLLAGITLNAFFSSLILFVQYLADFSQTMRTVRWLMGDLDVGSYAPIVVALPFLLAGFAVFAWLPRALNLLTLGADAASARGVDVQRTQRLAFFSASLATGAAVSLGGPVGFIGIIVPHLVRLLVGADHRLVLPASTLFGAAFLVVCDVAARTVIAPMVLPVGILTAMIGGPFFLWLLIRRG